MGGKTAAGSGTGKKPHQKTVHLSKRLQAVAELVTAGGRLADVGTDHAYIPIYLVGEGRISAAIAMDVKKGPLQIAQRNIRKAGLEPYITVRLSDGLEKLRPQEADVVVLAGMGGGLIRRILSEGCQKLTGVEEIVLQPQSEVSAVRSFLRENGMCITAEKMVYEGGKYYPMFRAAPFPRGGAAVPSGGAAVPSGGAAMPDTELSDAFGPLLLAQKDETLIRYLHEKQTLYRKISARLDAVDGPAAAKQDILQKMRLIERAFSFLEEIRHESVSKCQK